jgi:dTDP-glucose 4,6-dehydratase
MRALVTGGAGFIGSHLCDYLLEQGWEVIAMDNLITGNINNIAHLAGNSRFSFLKHDVTEYIYIKGPLDWVFHFASPASPLDYAEYPIPTLKVGALGTHNTLGLALTKKAKYLLASTSEVYGDPLEHPQNENYWGNVNPIGPRGVYDEAKRYAEAITFAYHRIHEVDVRIARIFNTFGPRMRPYDGRVVPTFINQAIRNDDITIFGDGEHTRSFCYITDTIQGFYKLVQSNEAYPVNIGNPDEMTINEFAELILEITESSSKVTFEELPENDPKVRQPDITKAKKVLGWEPVVPLREGLTKTIEYFQNIKEKKEV